MYNTLEWHDCVSKWMSSHVCIFVRGLGRSQPAKIFMRNDSCSENCFSYTSSLMLSSPTDRVIKVFNRSRLLERTWYSYDEKYWMMTMSPEPLPLNWVKEDCNQSCIYCTCSCTVWGGKTFCNKFVKCMQGLTVQK